MDTNVMLCNEASPEKLNSFDDSFIAEEKINGRRCRVKKTRDKIELIGRDALVPDNYPEILEAFKDQPESFDIDGELTVLDKTGRSVLELLQSKDKQRDKFKIKIMSKRMPATYIAFDILEVNGTDVKNVTQIERKKLLETTLKETDRIKINPYVEGSKATELFKEMCEKGREGVVVKKKSSTYVFDRSDNWIKIKRREKATIKVIGYEENPSGITVFNNDGYRVQVAGEKHIPVKEALDKFGFAVIRIIKMADTKNKEIVFDKLVI